MQQENRILPHHFEVQMQQYLADEFPSFIQSLQDTPPISIRLNDHKKAAFPSQLERVLWSKNGYYLTERPIFTLDPNFHAGAYYVQEAASMFLQYVIQSLYQEKDPIIALDLCAAPGGKSTILSSQLPPNSLLIANEVIKTRYNILRENLTKWGTSHLITTQLDSKQFHQLPGFFDLVLVDAPCSGEGLFRKDPKAIEEWSLENVKLCSARQRRILGNIVDSIKDDGLLIYCTCTYNEEENARNATWLHSNFELEPIELTIPNEWQITSKSFGYQFYPHKTKGEGFYLSIFRKKGGSMNRSKKDRGLKNFQKLPKAELRTISPWLSKLEDHQYYISYDQQIIAFPRSYSAILPILEKSFHKFEMGTALGTIKGNQLIPAHALALSTLLNRGLPTIKLTKEQALKYLAKEDLQLNTGKNGWHLVAYNSNSLGWIKQVSRRINNYYPKNWRIRMTLPKE